MISIFSLFGDSKEELCKHLSDARILGPDDKVILTCPKGYSMKDMSKLQEKIQKFLRGKGRGFILVREDDLIIVKDGIEITLKSLEE